MKNQHFAKTREIVIFEGEITIKKRGGDGELIVGEAGASCD